MHSYNLTLPHTCLHDLGIPLACLYPPMMHNRLVGTNVTQNYGIMVIGLFAMAAASTATISSWKEGAEE